MHIIGLIFLCLISFTLADLTRFKEDPLHAHDQLPRVAHPIGYELTIEPFFPYPGLETESKSSFYSN